MSEHANEKRLSIIKIFILGLAPGLVVLFWAFIFSSPIFGINFPMLLSLLLALLIGLIPTELGIMKYFAWKNNKGIKDIILFKEKTSIKRLFPSIIIPLIIAIPFFLSYQNMKVNYGEVFLTLFLIGSILISLMLTKQNILH